MRNLKQQLVLASWTDQYETRFKDALTRRYWWQDMPMVDLPSSLILLNYTNHAKTAIDKDIEFREYFIGLPKFLNPDTAKLIEIDVNSKGKVIKYLYEAEYSDDLDISLAIACNDSSYYVKTCWLNKKGYNENIRKRDWSNYAKPEISFQLNQLTKEFVKNPCKFQK